MKRKGFTLAELLIVIAIIGVLSSMMMVSGSSAANTARASKIVEGFNSVSGALLMYYTNNADACDDGTKDEEAIVKGIATYLKDGGNSVEADTKAQAGKYHFSIEDDKSWWLTYTLPDDDTDVGTILKDKATTLGLKNVPAAVEANDDEGIEAVEQGVYAGGATVCMKVR